MRGRGVSHGAVSVLNAMATGVGCAMGVELRTEARFRPSPGGRAVRILNDPGEDASMARVCVRRACGLAGEPEPDGWTLDVLSEIPPSRGLKSSSSACNAIISAVLDWFGAEATARERILLGVGCAREAGVTVTGALDDACGCELGGIVLADNARDEVLLRRGVRPMDAVIYVPEGKIRKRGLPLAAIRAAAPRMRELERTAADDPLKTMTEGGRLFAEAAGIDDSMAGRALAAGALAAGLSGSGPAVAALTEPGRGAALARALGPGRFLLTRTRGPAPRS